MAPGNQAFGAPSTGHRYFSSYANATALANDIGQHWMNYDAVSIGFVDGRYGRYLPYGLINTHMYTLAWVNYDGSGNVASLVLRNPWGFDTDSSSGPLDGYNDGYVTVTRDQLWSLVGAVDWGHV